MKYFRFIFLSMILFSASSCNQGKIEELQDEVYRLEKENKALKSRIAEFEEIIDAQKRYSSQQRNLQQQRDWHDQQRDWHNQQAQQHLRDAEFWKQAGDEFLYESSMRSAQHELDMMH